MLYRSIALLGLFFVIAAVTSGPLSAQTAAPDTLQMVKVLQEQGQFRDADPLIQQYYRDHSNDLYAAWMYGHNLHQLGKYHQAEEVYDIALEQHPDQLDMAFEYASKLIGRGRTSRAIPVLRAYLEKQAGYTPAMVSLAQCLYWEGQHDDAMAWIRNIYTEEPDHQAARELEKAIRNDRAPWLSLGTDLRRDDQPLKTVTWKFLAGIPVSPGLTLLAEADLPTFPDARIDRKGAPWLRGGGQLLFNRNRGTAKLMLGGTKLPVGSTELTISGQLSHRLSRSLRLELHGSREPYLWTAASLTQKTLFWKYGTGLEWQPSSGWMGRVEWLNQDLITDDNQLTTAGGWILSPPLKWTAFELRLGYGYEYHTSSQDRFTSDWTLDQALAMWLDSTTHIPGSYQPYFTPRQQQIHNAVAALAIQPSKALKLGIQATAGFYARTQQPYLFLDTDESGEAFIAKGFYTEKFTPILLSTYIDWQAGKGLNLRLDYQYQNTIFYRSHFGGLRLNYKFIHG